ncbi:MULTISPECIES: hypothetical protein [unclassified Streptomyces]|uniref:hypothetical protein n=1 Tax=unclassified Streptomyces TaxID=2593676 RepID=UPI0036EF88C7
MRRIGIALLAAVTLSGALSAAPAQAHGRQRVLGIDHCTATVCHFDVPPGTYDVRVTLGGEAASSTSGTAGARALRAPNPGH